MSPAVSHAARRLRVTHAVAAPHAAIMMQPTYVSFSTGISALYAQPIRK